MDQRVATFIDVDDELLLLDDANTQCNPCWKCHGTGILQPSTISFDDQLEDSPLLNDEHIEHLTIKEFHCHAPSEPETNSQQALRTLCIVSVLCFSFMLLEIVGGHIAGSVAVMTDAAHLFADLIGFLVSILSICIGQRAKTPQMTFGFHRVEVLGAFISVLIVWLLAGIFCYIAIERIWQNAIAINADIMMVVAVFGVVINIIMGFVLHGFCVKSDPNRTRCKHSHSHNINIRAAAAHVIGDLLQSVGVLIASVVIKLYPNAAIVDPICTVFFSVIVICVTYRVCNDSVLILIEAHVGDSMSIYTDLKCIASVRHVHSLKIWSLAPGKHAFSVHLAVEENCDRDKVLRKATSVVRRKLNAHSCAIQIERYDHEQMTTCIECN